MKVFFLNILFIFKLPVVLVVSANNTEDVFGVDSFGYLIIFSIAETVVLISSFVLKNPTDKRRSPSVTVPSVRCAIGAQ